MIIVSPMPGEFAEGHLSRIRIVNGVRSRSAAIQLLKSYSTDQRYLTSYLLADYAGINREEYVYRHSLLSMSKMATTFGANLKYGSEMGQRRFNYELRATSNSARVCRDCVKSDVDNHGFSWFRREHQLLGIETCLAHDTALYAISAKEPFGDTPHAQWERGNVHPLIVDLHLILTQGLHRTLTHPVEPKYGSDC